MSKEKEPITAEEFLRISAKSYGYEHLGQFSPEEMAKCMVEFAKWHREQIIKEIYQDAMVVLSESLPEGHIHEDDYLRVRSNIQKSIENAYDESKII